jgi:hypothetical protein
MESLIKRSFPSVKALFLILEFYDYLTIMIFCINPVHTRLAQLIALCLKVCGLETAWFRDSMV